MAFFSKLFRRNEIVPLHDNGRSQDLIRQGNKWLAEGNLNEARGFYEAAQQADTLNADAYVNLGFVLKELGRFTEAGKFLESAIRIDQQSVDGHFLLGLVEGLRGNGSAAIRHLRLTVELKPGFDIAWVALCQAYLTAQHIDEAKKAVAQGLAVFPELPDLLLIQGNIELLNKAYPPAIACYEKLLERVPDHPEAHNNYGSALRGMRRLEEALASYDRAIGLDSEYADAYCNRGVVLQEMNRLREAVTNFDRALGINPQLTEAHFNRGIALHELHRYKDAIDSYSRAISQKSDYVKAYGNRGNVFADLKDYPAAIADYGRAMQLGSSTDYLDGNLLLIKSRICDWHDYTQGLAQMLAKVENGERVSTPFAVIALTDNPAIQLRAAEIYASHKYPQLDDLGPISARGRTSRIRIGYYSADFHNHATTYLMAELFELHNKTEFELIGFSFGPDCQDEMRQRVSNALDRFIDVRDQSSKEIAQLSRDIGIDIAIDLKGFTQDSRADIFSYRAAPIQVSYLGYPGTMGVPYIDYLIADPTVIPVESLGYYAERVVYMPNSYQINDSKRKIAERKFTREELGLPAEGFVYCCFNNNYKISPTTFGCWMRILSRVSGSVLWLFEDNPLAVNNLRREAGRHGVSADRLVFAQPMPLPEHLARHRQADLFLDTLPYNAHTTASDALWTGLPVLTLPGSSFASRVAASLLMAVGLPWMIADSQDKYVQAAIDYAADLTMQASTKKVLDQSRLNSPLFDTALYTRHLEAAYREMFERYHRGEGPDAIYVRQGVVT